MVPLGRYSCTHGYLQNVPIQPTQDLSCLLLFPVTQVLSWFSGIWGAEAAPLLTIIHAPYNLEVPFSFHFSDLKLNAVWYKTELLIEEH